MKALVTCSDITVFLLPVVITWTFLLILLRMRSPRPSWPLIPVRIIGFTSSWAKDPRSV